jgi:biotin operon repressor
MDVNNMSKDEQVGFHKGSLSTLSKEREELARILNIVEQLMQMHIGALKELGVDISKGDDKKEVLKKKPVEDIL